MTTHTFKRALGVTTTINLEDTTPQEEQHTITELKNTVLECTHSNITIADNVQGNLLLIIQPTNQKTELHIQVGKNCTLNIGIQYAHQEEHAQHHTMTIEESSTVHLFTIIQGEGNLVLEQRNILKGEHAKLEHHSFVEHHGKVDYKATAEHEAPHTYSNTVVKGIVNAHCLNRNLVRIGKNAKNSDGYEKSDFLLTNKQARAISIPDLEIHNNDVRCSHGSTLSSVDDDHIFYMQSRGISKEEARAEIINGFREAAFNLLPEFVRGVVCKEI